MLGQRFVSALKPANSRSTPALRLFLQRLEERVSLITARQKKGFTLSYGSRQLLATLEIANIPALLSDPHFPRTIDEIIPALEQIYDPRLFQRNQQSKFVRSNTACYELVIPARMKVQPFMTDPNVSYSDERWQAVQPFRLYDMGSATLSFQVQTGYLQFDQHAPTYAFYTLDCRMLVLACLAYCRSFLQHRDFDELLPEFIHTQVVIPTLLRDTHSLWLRNVYKQQLMVDSPLEAFTATMWDGVTSNELGPEFTSAMREIVRVREDLRNQSISFSQALGALPLDSSRHSVASYYIALYESTPLSPQITSMWVECLKQLAWWEFFVLISSYLSAEPQVLSFRRAGRQDIGFALMTKPWQSTNGSMAFQGLFRGRLEGLHRYFRE